jgi:TRAP-type C4-dicarboxylate transport system permease small subunit
MRKLLERLCSTLSAVALFGIMMLTLVDVVSRKLLAGSIPGSLEVTELLLVVVIFAGLPLVSLHGEHVVFDSLDPLLPRAVRRVQDVLVDLLCAGSLGVIGWVMWTKAGQMLEYGDKTQQLGLTLGWFVYLMAVLLFISAAVHLLLIATPVPHHHIGVDEVGGGAA